MILNNVQWSLKMSNQRAWKESLNYFCFTANSRAFRYYCSLKHNDTKILHYDLPFYFLFYFPFSSKKHFPAKKYLATSLEIKIKRPCTLSPHNKHVCFHRKTVFFLTSVNMNQIFVLLQRRKLRVEGHTVVQGAYGPIGSQTPAFQGNNEEFMSHEEKNSSILL